MENELTVGKPEFGQQRENNVLDRIRTVMGIMAPGVLQAPKVGVAVLSPLQKQKLLAAALREAKVFKP